MAQLVARNVSRIFARSFSISSRCLAEETLLDPVEHAVGTEKKEILAKLAGNDNPFDMRVYKRAGGTKETPNLIPSHLESRMIGCICEEDATSINWMWVQKGSPKRCECGYYFKLVDAKPL